MRHAQHQKQKNEGKQHPNDDVHLVDREGEFVVELFLGVDEIRVVVVQQSLFLSALWALAAASSACSFSSWASRWASSASRRASSFSRWAWFISAMVVSSGVFLPVYHRIVTEKTPPAKSGLIPPADPPPHPSVETDRAGTRYSARPDEGPAPGQRRHLR